MRPLGFALGLDAALDKCQRLQEGLWCTWYLDNGTVVGSVDAVGDYLQALRPALESIGLHLNLSKTVAWGPGLQREGMPIAPEWSLLRDDHPFKQVHVIPFGPSKGICSLGVPVDCQGSAVEGDRKWSEAVEKTLALLGRLRYFPDGQVRHCLLRYCLDACRVNHLMRSTPHSIGAGNAAKLSTALSVAVGDLVGCGVPGHAWDQATLPIADGGLGVRDPSSCWVEARLAALIGFHRNASRNVGFFSDVARKFAPKTPRCWRRRPRSSAQTPTR